MAGRPTYDVDMNALQYLRTLGVPMAKLLGVSRQTLYNKIRGSGSPNAYRAYTPISDIALDRLVRSLKAHHPNTGEVMLAGCLTSEGVRIP